MTYKFKFGGNSTVVANGAAVYNIEESDLSDGFRVYDDLKITLLGEIFEKSAGYTVSLFGSQFITVGHDLKDQSERLQILINDDEYILKLDKLYLATVKLSKNSVSIETDDEARLILTVCLAVIIAKSKATKDETANELKEAEPAVHESAVLPQPNVEEVQKEAEETPENAEEKPNFSKTTIIEFFKGASGKLKKQILVLGAAILAFVITFIVSVSIFIGGVMQTNKLNVGTARVSSNGEWAILTLVNAEYTLDLPKQYSASSEITVYYTKNGSVVDKLYLSLPISYGWLALAGASVIGSGVSIILLGKLKKDFIKTKA